MYCIMRSTPVALCTKPHSYYIHYKIRMLCTVNMVAGHFAVLNITWLRACLCVCSWAMQFTRWIETFWTSSICSWWSWGAARATSSATPDPKAQTQVPRHYFSLLVTCMLDHRSQSVIKVLWKISSCSYLTVYLLPQFVSPYAPACLNHCALFLCVLRDAWWPDRISVLYVVVGSDTMFFFPLVHILPK